MTVVVRTVMVIRSFDNRYCSGGCENGCNNAESGTRLVGELGERCEHLASASGLMMEDGRYIQCKNQVMRGKTQETRGEILKNKACQWRELW